MSMQIMRWRAPRTLVISEPESSVTVVTSVTVAVTRLRATAMDSAAVVVVVEDRLPFKNEVRNTVVVVLVVLV